MLVLGRTEKHTGFWWVKIKERDHFEDLGIGGRIILKTSLKEIYWEAMNRTDMAQYRDKCRASLKAVLISVFYKMREIS